MKNWNLSLIGTLAIIFGASLWGVDGVILRPSLYHLDVPVVVFLEHLIAFGLMSTFLFKSISKLKKLKMGDWLTFLIIALLGGVTGTMAITKALFLVNFNHLSAIIILQKLQPIFAIIMSMIILKERPGKKFYLWALIALIGSYFITFGFHKPEFTQNNLFRASILSLLAAFSFGSSTVFGKRILQKIDFRTAIYVRFGLTSLLMIPVIIFLGRINKFSQLTPQNYGTLVIIALFTGILATFFYYWGLHKVQASKATLYELSFPVTAVILEYLIHKNIMSLGQLIGASLIILSMIMIVRIKENQH